MSKELTPLQALERIKSHYNDRVCVDILEDFDLIETALKRLEKIETTTHSVLREDIVKELKALEIIKKKRVNVDALIKYIKTNAVDDIPLCWYNEYIALFEEDRCLTEEEYDFLKEVLEK